MNSSEMFCISLFEIQWPTKILRCTMYSIWRLWDNWFDHGLIFLIYCNTIYTIKIVTSLPKYFVEALYSESAVCEAVWGQEFSFGFSERVWIGISCLSDRLTGRRDSVLCTIRLHTIRPTHVPPWLDTAESGVKAPAAENTNSCSYQFSSIPTPFLSTLPLALCPPLICKFTIVFFNMSK